MKHLSALAGLVFVAIAAGALACGGRTSDEKTGGSSGFGGASAGDATGGGGDAGSNPTSGAGGGNASGSGGAASGGQSGTGPGGQAGAGRAGQGGSGPAGQGGTGPGGQGGAGSSGDDAGGDCRPYNPPAVCSQNPTGEVTTQTIDAFRNAIAHRWLLCGTQSIFGQDKGDIGLEILPEGVWYKLYPGPGGSAVRGAGFDEEGKWEIVTVASGPGDIQPYQLNFNIFGSGFIYTHPVFSATPVAMRLNNNGVFVGNYLLDPSVPVGTSRCPATPDPTRTGICTPATDATFRETCDGAAATAAVLGRWSRCGGSTATTPAHDGIEFAVDGSFYFLFRDPMGGLVRGSRDTEHGTGVAAVGRPCQMVTDIRTLSGSTFYSSASPFDTSPRQLWIYSGNAWGDPERYTFDELP